MPPDIEKHQFQPAPLARFRIRLSGGSRMEHRPFNTAMSMQAYLLQAAVDYWTAVAFPAIYLAKYL